MPLIHVLWYLYRYLQFRMQGSLVVMDEDAAMVAKVQMSDPSKYECGFLGCKAAVAGDPMGSLERAHHTLHQPMGYYTKSWMVRCLRSPQRLHALPHYPVGVTIPGPEPIPVLKDCHDVIQQDALNAGMAPGHNLL